MKHLKSKTITTAFCFIIPFSLYAHTLAPQVTFGDSGELITAAYTLGLSHPPGFSLWTIITKIIMTVIPIGSIAWRANLASALFGAVAIALLSRLIIVNVRSQFRITMRPSVYISALSASLVFAFSKSLWSQAIVAEVYTLTLLIFTIQLTLLNIWIRKRKLVYFYWFAFTLGLGITNHYVILAVYPAYVLYILFARFSIFRNVRALIVAFFAFLAGLSFLLYVPIRAHSDTFMNWGHMDSLNDILDYLRRKQFGAGSIKFSDANIGIYVPVGDIYSASSLLKKLIVTPVQSIQILSYIFSPELIFVAGAGLTASLVKNINRSLTSSFIFLTMLCLFFSEYLFDVLTIYSNFHITGTALFFDRLIPHAIISIWIGYAFIWVSDYISKKYSHASIVFSLFLLSIPGFFVYKNYSDFNWHTNTTAYDHGVNVLNTIDMDAILFIDKNDWLFPILYLTAVEGMRPDITLYDRSGNLFENVYNLSETSIKSDRELDTYRRSIDEKIIAENPGRPVYYATDKDFEQYNYDVAQEGILYKHTSTPARNVDFKTEYASIMNREHIPWNDPDASYIVTYYHMRYADQLISENNQEEAVHELKIAQSLAPDIYLTQNQIGTYFGMLEYYEQAEEAYRNALLINPTSVIAQRNLGVVLVMLGRVDEALGELIKAYDLEPGSVQTNIRIAELYEKIEDEDGALRHYIAIATVDPNPKYVGKIISLSVRTGDCKQAELFAQKLHPDTPDIARLINNIGICWAQKSKFDNAKSAWETAIKIDPNYKKAQDNLEKLTTFTK